MQYWIVKNPQYICTVEYECSWWVNVWCGIIRGKLIDSYFIDVTVDERKYHNFFHQELLVCLEHFTILERQIMWFQHDGGVTHYSRIDREALTRDYTDHWIGRGGTVAWTARSPDLTLLDCREFHAFTRMV